MQRTSAGEAEGETIAEWSLPRVLKEIDERIQASLADSERLKQIPISTLDGLLEKGELGDAARPTLYDFIAHQAAVYYSQEIAAVAKPAETFEILADSPALGSLADFLAWQPETGAAPVGNALRLYQDLLHFHQKDEESTAFLHAQLDRLEWAHKVAKGEGKNDRYKAALWDFIAVNGGHPSSARARYMLAHKLSIDDEKQAHAVATAAFTTFPETIYAKMCGNIIHHIERKELSFATQSHWTSARESIDVSHRNVEKVWFRLYSINYKAEDDGPEQNNKTEAWLADFIAQNKPIKTWEQNLANEGDFKGKNSTFVVPQNLPMGDHLLVGSAAEDYSTKDNIVAYEIVHITNLAMVSRRANEGGVEGYVVDASTGSPLADIEVKAWWKDERDGEAVSQSSSVTNKQGVFTFKKARNFYHVVANRGLERAVSRSWAGGEKIHENQLTDQIVFFTDRSIYRPGQTIHFKGIWCRADKSNNSYELLKNRDDLVRILDPNRKEVAQLKLRTNERGSYSGQFTLPEGRVLGSYQIVSDGASSAVHFRVEEYKRPKFFAEIRAASHEAALNKEVKVTAFAEAYTGAAVDGAKIKWSVTRQIRWPDWRRWRYWNDENSSSAQETSHGEGVTAADGTFEITFTAKPDLAIAVEEEPIFDYLVTVDITDGAGETRSASRTISVAYTTFLARITAKEWLPSNEPVQLKVTTTSHDGEARAAEGTLKIHRLLEPAVCPRPEKNSYDDAHSSMNPNSWELAELVAEHQIKTAADGEQAGEDQCEQKLEAGYYRLIFEAKDSNGHPVKAFYGIQVVAPDSDDFPTMVPFYTQLISNNLQPGQEAELLWGSGHAEASALIEIYQNNVLLKREWTQPGRTQQMIRFPVSETQRGGFSIIVQQVTQNRYHVTTHRLDVPWTNQELKVRWEHVVNKLDPGAKETWTAIIEGPGGEAAAAELVATMYDASLDAFSRHMFRSLSSLFRIEQRMYLRGQMSSDYQSLNIVSSFDSPAHFYADDLYRRYFYGKSSFENGYWVGSRGEFLEARASFGEFESSSFGSLSDMTAAPMRASSIRSKTNSGLPEGSRNLEANNERAIDNGAPIPIRTNLNETAFFYPDLVSEADGKVRISFTMPEALTTWRFLALAHDSELRSGLLEREVVTTKDLMAQPNPPRFLREGDELEFTVKVTNRSDRTQSGVAKILLENAATGEIRHFALGVTELERAFEIPAKQSQTVSWRLKVPDGEGFLRYKVTASTETLSDGEEGWLPVIPRRVLVTDSMAMSIRDAGTKEFEFQSLLDSGDSDSIENRFLDLQVVSQPVWYGVMALPYLMNFPHECAEQPFNRYYANALAAHIANSDPKIRRIFDLWKNSEALDSPLLKNQDLKGLLIEETPWLAEAEDETEARRRVGLLFDENHLSNELEKALNKVREMQGNDGLWPWFPGGRGDEYISLYIATGFARLRNLGVDTDITPALRAMEGIDAEVTKIYERIDAKGRGKNHLTPWLAHYLYTRTFFLNDKHIEAKNVVAFDYFVDQAKKYWVQVSHRQARAHIALALHRLGDSDTAKLITRSLKENAIVDEEQGMRWKKANSWWWWEAPIESQAMMIEAFAEIDGDAQAVEDCQVWLIKQKQVSDWGTTKATSDAISALLMRGINLLDSDALLEVKLGNTAVEAASKSRNTGDRSSTQAEPGIGKYEQRFIGKEVKSELGKVTLTKTDDGVSWASLHWQYLEDVGKVKSAAGDELQLEKKLFIKRRAANGEELIPVNGPLEVGDELVTRLILRNDRAMEYVHLKDQRGSGTEPMNVLSGYRWQDGFGFYEMTRDTASHFYIDRLPAGTHVFETSVRIQHRGLYQTGLAEIRCMYAPEFSAHSGSMTVEVK